MRANVTCFTRRISSWRQAIQQNNAAINAFVYVSPPSPPRPESKLPLDGLAVAVKDMICTKDMPTTSSSVMLKDFTPPFDATIVRLLREAGADLVGKVNCDEFGMGSLNIHSAHGPVINPFQTSNPVSREQPERRSAGGSSGGSAAAVAAGMCYAYVICTILSTFLLTKQCIRCLLCPPNANKRFRWGVISFADSLDCVGIMAKTVSATRHIFNTLNAYDAQDPTSVNEESRRIASRQAVRAWSGSSLSDLKIGIPQEYFPRELAPQVSGPVRDTIAALKSRGATVVPVSLPTTPYALSAYYVISSAEASSNMARYDGVEYGMRVASKNDDHFPNTAARYAVTRTAGFGSEVQKRILLGTYALSAEAFDNYFLQAQRVRQLIKDDFNRIFRIPDVLGYSETTELLTNNDEGVDVLIHPSAMRTAPRLDDIPTAESLDAYVQDVLTVPASLAGLPALSVPLQRDSDEWPVGVSVVGQWGTDETVLRVGHFIESLQ
ncbi:Glutamyl-tRNA(Gln) amidotransferase subunit A, mitochondrial [Mycena indigotica]|uniref:Glutamyl-tRNA(Gln) amidotransferase subunit A, mitochondrial n=1 Tax=Mycena indigotica TaxID=2126181 RepID=A0A8H6WEG6_9AGAR|nr:Glutamyl-tRNA(Gln) amidotransferase subunit A, mitochondrial [Mycena indigotica]KAF7309444.1 Glutamyl-tRNA(Gln) amidotransferase subunit A, mitochondrial [Mycena indigotica]